MTTPIETASAPATEPWEQALLESAAAYRIGDRRTGERLFQQLFASGLEQLIKQRCRLFAGRYQRLSRGVGVQLPADLYADVVGEAVARVAASVMNGQSMGPGLVTKICRDAAFDVMVRPGAGEEKHHKGRAGREQRGRSSSNEERLIDLIESAADEQGEEGYRSALWRFDVDKCVQYLRTDEFPDGTLGLNRPLWAEIVSLIALKGLKSDTELGAALDMHPGTVRRHLMELSNFMLGWGRKFFDGWTPSTASTIESQEQS